ncbi:MAG TPA: M23 family metallopeptidase, partial [Polyangiaceae bacterium]|nr:M23 family metallopeptidase [Polyangiaceae bacterium]
MTTNSTEEPTDLAETGGAPESPPLEPSSAGEARTRVVARIVDPAVRDDGRGDPMLVLHTAEARERMQRSLGPGASNRSPSSASTSAAHAMRARRWARAEEAGKDAEPPTEPEPIGALEQANGCERASEPDLDLEGPNQERADDLDLIGAPERPRSLPLGKDAPRLSASGTLLLGTLGGVLTLGALFAVLAWLAPRPPLTLDHRAATPVLAEAPKSAPAVVASTPAASADAVVREAEPAQVASTAALLRANPNETIPAQPTRVEPPQSAPPPAAPQSPAHVATRAPWRIADAAHDPGLRLVTGKIGKETLTGALQRIGLSHREAYRALTALRPVKDPNKCQPHDALAALIDTTGQLVAFEYTLSDEEVYQARLLPDGSFLAQKLDLDVRREHTRAVLVLDGGFEAASARAGFEPGLAEVVNRALSGYITTNEMKPGDVLSLLVEEVLVLGKFERYAGIEALEYRNGHTDPLRIYRRDSGKTQTYVDAKGRVFGRSRWSRPVAGFRISSRFNLRRFHPILKRIKPHNGTDFAAPVGTPILAASSGRVTFVGSAGPNGNMVRVSHGAGYETGYSHLSRFAKGLRPGARVEQRQVIGYVGSTGRSTGPHLHFSAKRNGRFIDPESLNLDGLLRTPSVDRQSLA